MIPTEPSCRDHCQIWMWRTGVGGGWLRWFPWPSQLERSHRPTHQRTGRCLAGGATLALNIPEFCPVSCNSPECPYRCSRDWKDGGEVPNTQQQRCGVLLVTFVPSLRLMRTDRKKAGIPSCEHSTPLQPWNLDHGWPWRAMVAGVGHRSTVVYRAWMQSSWVRWVPFCRCSWNGNESHRTFNVVLVCCSCSFFNCSVYFFPFFGGEEATTFFSGEVLCWRGFVRQDCHCKCAAEYIQMSLILGRAPCQTEALKWRWFHGGKVTWGCDHLRKIGCCFYSACILY